MDTSPIPGFITRKQAAVRCKRVERTLQRYWSRAIEHRNDDVLKHLQLRTEDGDIIEGTDVTKELIERLKKERKNPTWYVHATWVEKTYGPRMEKKATVKKVAPEEEGTPSDGDSPPALQTRAALLTERIAHLEEDKKELRDELNIKNEQIKEANERNRETHVLMRDLHELIRDLQKRLPAPATSTLPSPQSSSSPHDVVVVTETEPSEKGSRATPAKKTARKRKPANRRSTNRKREQHSGNTVVDDDTQSFLERHLPTLSRPFRRK